MITINDIGLNLNVSGPVCTLRSLEAELEKVRGHGYRLVEIGVSPWAVVVNGEIRQKRLADLTAVLARAGLRYSVHGIGRLNLAFDPRHDLCRRIMRAQIGLCAAIGATRLVYHSGLQALDEVAHGTRALRTDQELEEGARREVKAFKELAPVAADAGVVIGMENLDPHSWEHTIIERLGLPKDDIVKHLPRLRVGPIVRQLEAVDHPSVGMTLDVGHLYMAANDLGFDYLEEIRAAAPWARHLHVNDNFGRNDWGNMGGWDTWAFGEADLHMPPGWGSLPYAEAFRLLPDYCGDMVLEIETGFEDCYGEALQATRAILQGLR